MERSKLPLTLTEGLVKPSLRFWSALVGVPTGEVACEDTDDTCDVRGTRTCSAGSRVSVVASSRPSVSDRTLGDGGWTGATDEWELCCVRGSTVEKASDVSEPASDSPLAEHIELRRDNGLRREREEGRSGAVAGAAPGPMGTGRNFLDFFLGRGLCLALSFSTALRTFSGLRLNFFRIGNP